MSKSGKIDLDTGELVSVSDAPFSRPPWHRMRIVTKIHGESKTQQHHKDTVDINAIVNRYQRTGELPPAKTPPQYADVTGLQGDLQERITASQKAIAKADSDLAANHKKKQDKAAADKVEAAGTRLTGSSSNVSQAPTPGGSPPEK